MKELVKLVTFVPVDSADKVRQAMTHAGAGKVGKYTDCTFSSRGVSRFKPEQGANPAIGEIGKLEEVEEEKIEVACERDQVKQVIAELKKAHPYEEFVLDIYPMLVLEGD